MVSGLASVKRPIAAIALVAAASAPAREPAAAPAAQVAPARPWTDEARGRKPVEVQYRVAPESYRVSIARDAGQPVLAGTAELRERRLAP